MKTGVLCSQTPPQFLCVCVEVALIRLSSGAPSLNLAGLCLGSWAHSLPKLKGGFPFISGPKKITQRLFVVVEATNLPKALCFSNWFTL